MTSPRELLEDLQRTRGLNQRGVAEQLGVVPSTVTRWRRGASPRHETTRALHVLSGRVPDEHPLRRARLDARLTVQQLAAAVPTSPTAVSHWEAGRRTPGEQSRARLAVVLGHPQQEVDAWFGLVAGRREHAVPGLAHVRRERGWSQRDVALLWGVSPAFVQRLEATRRRLDDQELEGLCAALSLTDAERVLLSRPLLRPTPPVGTRAERLRRAKGITLAHAASHARLSPARLRALELGRARLDLGTARRLAVAYGVPLRTLLAVFGEELPAGLEARSWHSLTLPEGLRMLRLWTGLRWPDLARLTGRSESTLRRWHAGSRIPDASGITALEVAYGLDVGRLAGLRRLPASSRTSMHLASTTTRTST